MGVVVSPEQMVLIQQQQQQGQMIIPVNRVNQQITASTIHASQVEYVNVPPPAYDQIAASAPPEVFEDDGDKFKSEGRIKLKMVIKGALALLLPPMHCTLQQYLLV